MTTPELGPDPTLLCRKCHAPFLDYTPQPRHPVVSIQNLRSNCLPSEAEVLQSNEVLGVEMVELERLDKGIRRLRLALAELESHRDVLCQSIQRRRSWISPVRGLPVEIIREIFSYTCLGNRHDEFSLDINTVTRIDPGNRIVVLKTTVATTCRLSHVCHGWRDIIIASPQLWSSLRLNMSRMEEKQAKLVELYLTNSAQHPLKIFLHEHARYAWSDDEDIDDTMGITGFNVFCSVIAELHRCREFHYAVSSGGLLGEVGPVRYKHAELPLLTVFSERVVWGFNVPEARWFWNLVKNSPNLINLAVNGLKDNWRYPRSLQILKISYQENYSSLFEVLSYLPNLKTLHLHTIYSRESPVFRLAEPLSIGLRDVTITTPGQLERLTLLFDSLILPTLSSLTILTCQQFSFPDEVPTTNQSDSDVTSYRDNQLTALHALVQRSACTLRELTLYVEPFSSADILSILELQPSLTGLELEIRVPRTQTPSLSSVLVDLCARMSHPGSPLLPNLRRLSIHETLYVDYREYDINDALCHAACVVDMLESRELGRSGEAPRVTEVMLKFGRVVPLGYATTVQSEYKIPVDLVRRVQALEEKRIRCHITLPIMVEGESFRDEE